MRALRKYVLVLALLAAAFFGAFAAEEYAGSVRVEWLGYRVDSNVPFFLTATLALYLVVSLVARIIGAALFPGEHIENYRRRRLTSALIAVNAALLSGDVAKMRRSIGKLTKNFTERERGLVRAVRAHIARERDCLLEARALYQSLGERGDDGLAALRGLAYVEYEEGNVDAALALAEKARRLAEDAPWIDRLGARIYVERKHWDKAREPLARLANAALSPYRRPFAVVLLLRAQELLRAGQKTAALKMGIEAHKALPNDAEITILYASLLDGAGEFGALEELVSSEWKNGRPSVPLGRLLFRKRGGEGDGERDRKRRMDRLRDARPEAPETWLVVAEAFADGERLAEAKGAAEQCASLRPCAEAYGLLADIEEKQGGADRATSEEKREKARRAPRLSEGFACRSCSLISPIPALACDRCGAVNVPNVEM
ncbi:MAG: heme biosynthesis HemY N-terminal domain-containing protein [Rickettsiales bacterium]